MIQPKISVVTVCYNAVNDIEKTILSVINQTYPNIEYLIIDGGSKDGTMDIVNKYKDKIDVIVSEPDKGIYDAMNKGIDRATGEWINFMNAGDSFALETIVEQIFKIPFLQEIKVVYGDVIKNSSNKILKASKISSLSHKMPFCHQSAFLKLPTELFDTNYKIAADYKIFFLLYNKRGKSCFKYIPMPFAIFEDEDGISSTAIRKLQDETLEIMADNKSIWYYYLKVKLKITRMLCR